MGNWKTEVGLEPGAFKWQKAPTLGPRVSKRMKEAPHNLKKDPGENNGLDISCRCLYRSETVSIPEVICLSTPDSCAEVTSQVAYVVVLN